MGPSPAPPRRDEPHLQLTLSLNERRGSRPGVRHLPLRSGAAILPLTRPPIRAHRTPSRALVRSSRIAWTPGGERTMPTGRGRYTRTTERVFTGAVILAA